MALTFDGIVQLVKQERAAQDTQWGGHAHDIHHSAFEWCIYIQKQLDYANDDTYVYNLSLEQQEDEFQERMVKIAALAFAAIEARIP